MRTSTRTRRWQAVACGALAGLLAGSPAVAVHDDGVFELDGDAVDGAAAGEDWNTVFGIVAPFPKTPVFDGFGDVFIVDAGNNDSAYAAGNKDTYDPSIWEWKLARAAREAEGRRAAEEEIARLRRELEERDRD